MRPAFYDDGDVRLFHGNALDVLTELDDASVDCVVTSPPYFGLRDYPVEPSAWPEVTYAPMAGLPAVTVPAMDCVLGLEPDPIAFVGHLVSLFRQVHRALATDGTVWLNLGDSYAGKANGGETFDRHRGSSHKAGIVAAKRYMLDHAPYKSAMQIPQRASLALVADGWTLRNDIVWHKPNGMPESVGDRLGTKHEQVFLLTKGRSYYFDLDAIRERPRRDRGKSWEERKADGAPKRHGARGVDGDSDWRGHPLGRNPGDVWSISTVPFPHEHFATMPPELALRCVTAGCRPGGVVLDPFSGSGTTGMAASKRGCRYVGIDASAASLELSLQTRLAQGALLDEASA